MLTVLSIIGALAFIISALVCVVAATANLLPDTPFYPDEDYRARRLLATAALAFAFIAGLLF